jgi:hypothetical protein
MIDPHDNMFAARLEQRIRMILNGESPDKPGLYAGMMSANNWDDLLRTRSQIIAYEIVLNLMREVAMTINEGEEPRRPHAHAPRVN